VTAASSEVDYFGQLTEETVRKARAALTPEDLACDAFVDAEAACLAVMRAQALLDADRSPDGPRRDAGFRAAQQSWTPAAYLLTGRAALWLARDAQRRFPIAMPAGECEELSLSSAGLSLAGFMQACLQAAFARPEIAPLALTVWGQAFIDRTGWPATRAIRRDQGWRRRGC
jgi:hypothetical protein